MRHDTHGIPCTQKRSAPTCIGTLRAHCPDRVAATRSARNARTRGAHHIRTRRAHRLRAQGAQLPHTRDAQHSHTQSTSPSRTGRITSACAVRTASTRTGRFALARPARTAPAHAGRIAFVRTACTAPARAQRTGYPSPEPLSLEVRGALARHPLGLELGVAAVDDRLAGAAHEVEQEVDVVLRQQDAAEHLLLRDHMADERA